MRFCTSLLNNDGLSWYGNQASKILLVYVTIKEWILFSSQANKIEFYLFNEQAKLFFVQNIWSYFNWLLPQTNQMYIRSRQGFAARFAVTYLVARGLVVPSKFLTKVMCMFCEKSKIALLLANSTQLFSQNTAPNLDHNPSQTRQAFKTIF